MMMMLIVLQGGPKKWHPFGIWASSHAT